MSRELHCSFPGDSANLYAQIRRPSDGFVWNGSAFAAWADGSVADYDIALTARGGDHYDADFPTAITGAATYVIRYYERAGATPAITDTLLRTERLYWNGTAASEPGDVTIDAYALTTMTSAKRHMRIDASDTTNDNLVGQIINQASPYIESITGRLFKVRDYRWWINGEIQRTLMLPQWPLVYPPRIAYGSANAMSVTYTGSAIRANVGVGDTGILLHTIATNGTATRNHLLFTDYASVSTMETAIEAVSGWSATVHANMPSADLHQCGSEDALNRTVELTYPDRDMSEFSVDMARGIVEFKRMDWWIPVHDGHRARPALGHWGGPRYFPKHHQGILVEGRAGYSTIPSDVELVANELVNIKFFDGETSPYVKSMALGPFNVAFSDIDHQYVVKRLSHYIDARAYVG